MWWPFTVVVGLASAKLCEDALDWWPGKRLRREPAARLQQSTLSAGDARRFRPLLWKLSSKNSTVRVLIIEGPAEREKDVTANHTWSDALSESLRRLFAAKIKSSRIYLQGALSEHLHVIPAWSTLVAPDLVVVDISTTPLVKLAQYKSSGADKAPQHLVEETFIRSILRLDGHPALIWIDTHWPGHADNEVGLLLAEYYKVPQVRVWGAQHYRPPWKELRDGKSLSLLWHKFVGAAVSNSVCSEFVHACQSEGPASTEMPAALFATTSELKLGSSEPKPEAAGKPDVPFCREAELSTVAEGSAGDRLAWSLAATLAVLPLGVFHALASLTKGGGHFVENMLPQSMPELEVLRIAGTLNIVAWQYYQDLPPAWSQPGTVVSEVCHEQYYRHPNWEPREKVGSACAPKAHCVWCRSGKYCFQFFLLLQAFVLTLSAVRAGTASPTWQYAQALPSHALSVALAAAASAPLEPLDTALVLGLVRAWVTPFYSELNGASWYLSVLAGFWLALPAWLRAADRLAASSGVAGIVSALVAVWLCTLALPVLTYVWPVRLGLREVDPRMAIHNFVEYSPYANWQPVAMGLLLAMLVMLGVEPCTPVTVALCFAVSLLGLGLVWFAVPSPGFSLGSDYLLLDKGFGLLPLFAMLVLGSVGARNTPNPLHRALTGKTMLSMAKLCWPVFILHQPVHRLCVKVLFPPLRPLGLPSAVYMLLYPLTLLAVAAATSQLVDKPWAAFLYRCRASSGVSVALADGAMGSSGGKDPSYRKLSRADGDEERPPQSQFAWGASAFCM